MSAALEPGRRIYAIGDLHGCQTLLDALLDEIRADLRGWQGETLVVFLGDYVDRGPHSAQLVERLQQGVGSLGLDPDCRLVCLKGNHEDLFLRALEGPDSLSVWLANGGEETCLSYGIDLDRLAGEGRLYADLTEILRCEVPQAHQAFLARLPLFYSAGGYYFCHAGVRPGIALERQCEEDLLWIRDRFLRSDRDHGKVVVHGHTPSHGPELHHNRIGIDTGAVYGGKLTAVVLEENRRHLLSV